MNYQFLSFPKALVTPSPYSSYCSLADIMQTLRRRYADVTQMMCKLSQCRGASSHPAYLFGADGDTDEP